MPNGPGVNVQETDTVEVINASGRGRFVLVCEHASNAIPNHMNSLGLDADSLTTHIAWDPGAREVALAMSKRLDAPLVAPKVSRLVIDCNREKDAASAIPEKSEAYAIPGNVGLGAAERERRQALYYAPFHAALTNLLDERANRGLSSVLITVHSFTPVYHGVPRTVELGVLHDSDARLAEAILDVSEERKDMLAIRNAPYGPDDGVTYTLVRHALPRRILNVMLEIRNDLIATPSEQETMALRLADYATHAVRTLETRKEGIAHA